MKCALSAFLFVICPAYCGAQGDDPLTDIKKGQPKAIGDIVDRIVGCNHWSGEPAYDAARSREIEEALKELKCSQLQSDVMRIKKKYSSPGVKKALDAANEFGY